MVTKRGHGQACQRPPPVSGGGLWLVGAGWLGPGNLALATTLEPAGPGWPGLAGLALAGLWGGLWLALAGLLGLALAGLWGGLSSSLGSSLSSLEAGQGASHGDRNA